MVDRTHTTEPCCICHRPLGLFRVDRPEGVAHPQCAVDEADLDEMLQEQKP